MSAAVRAPDDRIVRYEGAGFWSRRGLVDQLRHWADKQPRAELVIDRFGRHTYATVLEWVDALVAGLASIGVEENERVAVQLPNWHPWIVLALALEQLGAVIVPIPVVYRAKEVVDVLRISSARTLVTVASFKGFDHVAMVQSIRDQVPELERVVTVGEKAPGFPSYEELRDERLPMPPLRPVDPNALREIVFTSGSTGEPKGVMHTANTVACDYVVMTRGCEVDHDAVVLMASPMGHQLGFVHGACVPVHLGARAVLMDAWDPKLGVETMAREKVTFACTTPTFLVDVLRAPNLKEHGSLPSMRVWALAGAVVPSALHAEAREKLPHVRLSQVFGMTEVGAVILNPPGSPPSKMMATGSAPAGVELRVVDDSFRELPPETDGELVIRSPSTFLGYYARPEVTAASFTPDGFFRSGDQVRIDGDGFLRVTGRIKDLIKRGGESVSPAEVEEVLLRMPAVADAAVVGMPDVRLGERICAFTVLRPGKTLEHAEVVAAMAQAGLAKQKWPERLEIVESFPRTSIGKVHKAELKALITEKLAREAVR